MIIKVKVITKASVNQVQKAANTGLDYKVKTTAVAEKGKANREVIRLLAEYLQISPAQITIKVGQTSSLKTISINE